jgi:hypothetical protein
MIQISFFSSNFVGQSFYLTCSFTSLLQAESNETVSEKIIIYARFLIDVFVDFLSCYLA